MANNRLYIGNKETKECRCISKAGNNWRKLTMKDLKLLNEIVITDIIWQDKTDLVLFTEADDKLYFYFFDEGQLKKS